MVHAVEVERKAVTVGVISHGRRVTVHGSKIQGLNSVPGPKIQGLHIKFIKTLPPKDGLTLKLPSASLNDSNARPL